MTSVAESETDVEEQFVQIPDPKQDVNDPEQEPAEMTALRLELSTLSVSHNSLQATLVLLQTQLNDLKRVNNELQEENESYNILLREKTLSGQFDVLRMGGSSINEASESSEAGDEDDRDAESLLSRNTNKSVLDPVDERDERLDNQEHELDPDFQQGDLEPELKDPESPARAPRRGGRRRTTSATSRSPAPLGESLANLPITGPGLDLAAELGRAENKDLVEGRATLETDRSILNPKGKRGRKGTDRKVSSMSEGAIDPNAVPDDIETLRSEVKNLKDANKALSLYASKIIDRIISQEGFEHVLAVDYDKSPPPQSAKFTTFSDVIPKSPVPGAPQPSKKARPQSAIFSFSSSPIPPAATPPQERLTTFDDIRAAAAASKSTESSSSRPSMRASRRSLSFDWSKFSMFGGAEKKPEPSLRPLTLKPGSSSVVGSARKLDTQEDEEDRRERERLHATMKLMGIDKPLTPPPLGKSVSSPAGGVPSPITASTVTPGTAGPMSPALATSRFSFFRRANSDAGSTYSSPAVGSTPNLTQEALEQAEAESTIAALEAHERQLSAEIAKGSPGGFTEIVRRTGDRRSSRRSGSGSTVWSAGMSKGEGDDD